MHRSIVEALAGLSATGAAIRVAVGEHSDFVWGGRLSGEQVTPESFFYGASVTKQIVGLLVAQAVTNQLMRPSDSITTWLPQLPDWMAPVQLSHLLHHTSGLTDLTDPAHGVPQNNAEVIQRFQRVTHAPSLHPGIKYAYNNAGYVLLAEALAAVQERPITDVVASLFSALGLTHSRVGGQVHSQPMIVDPPGTVGDGGLWTSIVDLTAWLQACNRSVLGYVVHRRAESLSRPVDGWSIDYAWGVRITSTHSGRLITHGGSWEGWLAKTVRIPEQQIAVAVLSIGSNANAVSDTGIRLAETFASL